MITVAALLSAACVSEDPATGSETLPPATELAEDDAESESAADSEEVIVSDRPLSELGFEQVTIAIANSPGTLTTNGDQRLMTALIEPSGVGYLGGPDEQVEILVLPFEADSTQDEQRLPATWLTAEDVALGLYMSTPTFDAAGTWEVRIVAGGADIGGTIVEVADESLVPQRGMAAPASVTNPYNGVSNIFDYTTDPDPNLEFYRLSLDEAIANGRPTVVAFATPIFCQTALCGPTLEWVKAATDGRDGVDVVHIEPFDLEQAKTGVLTPIPAMTEWNLPTEPWVFVVDKTGTVTAAFEGIFAPAELKAALDDLS